MRPVLRLWLPRTLALLILLAAGYILVRDRQELVDAYRTMGLGALLVSGALAALGTSCIGMIWLQMVRGLGGHTPSGPALRLFFTTQLGKYLPGSVWPVVAQMEFGRRIGLGRSRMLLSNILMMAVVTLTGLLAGAAALPFARAGAAGSRWWLLLFVVPLAASLHPRAVPALFDLGLRLIHRPPLGLRLEPRRMLAAVAWGLVTWVLLGAHIFVMVHALGAGGFAAWAASTGGMGLAFAAGLIFIPAPAGAGLRDGVLTAALATVVDHRNALAVAVASRVLLVLADIGLAAVSAIVGRRSRRAGVTPVDQVSA